MNTLKNIDKQVQQIEASEESKVAAATATQQQLGVFFSPQMPHSSNVKQHMDLFGLKPK